MRISDWSSDVCSSDLPDLTAGEGDDGTFGRELFAALAGALGEIVAGIDHRGGDPARHPAAAGRRVGTASLDAIDFGGMVAHAFHRIAAALQCLAQQLRLIELRAVDLARIEAAGEVSELLGRVVLAVAETLGDDMDVVGDTPVVVAGERLEARG